MFHIFPRLASIPNAALVATADTAVAINGPHNVLKAVRVELPVCDPE